MNAFTLVSPLDGTLVVLEKVPDPAFSQHLLGNGLAIFPTSETLFSPLDATVTNINPAKHALVLTSGKLEILIHVGLESVTLQGEGFELFVQKGQRVKAGQKLLGFNLNLLTKKAASPLVLLVITSPADTPVTLLAEEQVKTGLPLLQASLPQTETNTLSSSEKTESAPLTLANPNGLHARPAAILAGLAAEHPYRVEIFTEHQTADAKSIVSLMGLGLTYGDTITIRVFGPKEQAHPVLTRLQEAFQQGLGEATTNTLMLHKKEIPPLPPSPVITGICACSGLACGPAYLLKTNALSFEENTANIQAEHEALDEALTTLSEQMEKRIAAEQNAVTRDILNAHLLLLKDPLLADTTRKTISQGKTAAFAFNSAIRRSIDILKQTNNRFLMERIADLKDLRREVLSQLTGQQHRLLDIAKGSIVVAEDLLPSDVSALPEHTAGVLLANGSLTTHASILLRNRNIPAIVRAGQEVLSIPAQTTILLDADCGKAIISPSAKQIKDFTARLNLSRERNRQEYAHAQEPARTQDGIHIFVQGNISNADEAKLAFQSGAEGFGLVRTEFLFQHRAFEPTEEEQRASYQAILDASPTQAVTFRLLDAGGDKPLPFINTAPEENPILGVRGVRVAKHNEPFFRTQLRALLRLVPQERVRIMLPMVTFTEEISSFQNMLEEEAKALGITKTAQLGIMIEVPAAALQAEQFARQVAFFSVGTNDLAQYVLAIDRGHKELSPLADPLHPAVLKLIAETCRGASIHHKPVAICGAMAGEPAAIPLLIGLGITSLAVSSGVIARTKALLRRLNQKVCAEVAQEALQLPDAQAVRTLIEQKFNI